MGVFAILLCCRRNPNPDFHRAGIGVAVPAGVAVTPPCSVDESPRPMVRHARIADGINLPPDNGLGFWGQVSPSVTPGLSTSEQKSGRQKRPGAQQSGTRPITINVDVGIKRRLDAEAKRRGQSLAAMLREELTPFFESLQ